MTDVALVPGNIPTEFNTTMMFLQKLENGVTNPDQRSLLITYHREMQSCVNVNYPPATITEIELALTDLESKTQPKTRSYTPRQASHQPSDQRRV